MANSKSFSVGALLIGVYGLFAIASLLSFAGWGMARVYFALAYDSDCDGLIRQAAQAADTRIALNYLSDAVNFMQNDGFTSGSTHISWLEKPDSAEDLGRWFGKLKLWQARLSADADPRLIEQMKTDLVSPDDEDGDDFVVRSPAGISVFPHNSAFAIWGFVSMWGCVLCAPVYLSAFDG